MATTTLPALLQTGLAAARPAASSVGSGALYAATDTGVIYQSDGTSWSTWATLGTAGAVTGPGSSTDNDLVAFSGTSGSVLKDSGLSLDTDGTLTADSDSKIPSQKAVKTYADQLLGAAHALEYKGATDCSANPNYPAGAVGDLYMVSVAGKIGGASGTSVNAGDLFVCVTANAGGTQAAVGADWDVIHATATGSVTGPGTAVSGDFAQFNGTTGAILEDGGLSLDTDGTLAADSDTKIASQKAVKTYVDAQVAAGGGSGDALNTVSASGASHTVDFSAADVWDITLTANCTLSLSGFTTGKPDYLTLVLRQDATGGRTVTWPTITWIGTGLPPTLHSGAGNVDSIVLFSFDGGTTVYGIAQTSASGLASGTSFPGSPSDGDLFYRTDRRIIYEWNATAGHWLSLDRKYWSFNEGGALQGSGTASYYGMLPVFEDVYIESFACVTFVFATNNGSNYWTVTLSKVSPGNTQTSVATFTTAADTAANWILHNIAVNAVVAAASFPLLEYATGKTGGPGSGYFAGTIITRSVG